MGAVPLSEEHHWSLCRITASSLTLAGDIIGQGTGVTYPDGPNSIGNDHMNGGLRWYALSNQRNNGSPSVVLITAQSLQNQPGVGTYYTKSPPGPQDNSMNTGVGGLGCNGHDRSFFTINAIAYDADGMPTMADISFTAYCTWDKTPPATGRIQWRVRKDLTGPSPAESLAITGSGSARTISWVKWASPDYSYAVVRLARQRCRRYADERVRRVFGHGSRGDAAPHDEGREVHRGRVPRGQDGKCEQANVGLGTG